MQIAADIFTYSLLNGAMKISEIATVKTSEISDPSDAISFIIKRNSNANRKYLFALDQSKLTPKQLAKSAERKVCGLFATKNIQEVESVDDTIMGHKTKR